MIQKSTKKAIELIRECVENKWPYLDLSYLQLDSLPEEIIEAKHVQELNLSYNNLFHLSPVINEFTRLTRLDLSFNNLNEVRGLSMEFPCKIPLEYINLSNNLFEDIPDDLDFLFELPSFSMYNNPLWNQVPKEIADYGIETVSHYLNELRESNKSVRILESKLIFVGRGDVGKTTLMKKLVDPNFKPIEGKEKTTHGININQWQIPMKIPTIEEYSYLNDFYFEDTILPEDVIYDSGLDDNSSDDGYLSSDFNLGYVQRNVNVNVWDFGGQDIYRSTHQFFLTKRSVYVLVWDARKEEQYEYFEYWLNTINILSNKSKVLLVMSKNDVRSKSIDEATLSAKFPNIVGFYQLSSFTNDGIEEFRNDTIETILGLPHLKDRIPKSWENLKINLDSLDDNYIDSLTFETICARYSINQRRLINLFSDYLHDLGLILHYKTDPVLENMVVLNPSWLTSAVYKLIDSKEIIKSQGKFNYSNIKKEWDSRIYPRDKYHALLRLLEKFELCFNLIGTYDYVLPQLLPQTIEYDLSEFNIRNKNRLEFIYNYEFMPEGIITRFICRTHTWIEKKLFWFNGVVLKYEGSRALIEQNRINKKIKVIIFGEDRAEFLSIIKEHFKSIHKTLNINTPKDYNELVPCICEECKISNEPYYFKMSVIKTFRSKRKETIDCQKSAQTINIFSLISGYESKKKVNILSNILIACSQLQGMHLSLKEKEDDRNGFIAAFLNSNGLISKDQSRWGKSETGKNQGELDIKIEDSEGRNIGIFEGFNLKYLDKKVIKEHLLKIFKYDSNGLKQNYIVIYVTSDKFIDLWKKYLSYINSIEYKYALLSNSIDITQNVNENAEIKVGLTEHERQGITVKLYHIFINMF